MHCHCGHVHAPNEIARMSIQLFYELDDIAQAMARTVVAVVGDGPGCDCRHGHGGPSIECPCCWCRVGFWGFDPLPAFTPCFGCGRPWHQASGFVWGPQDTPICKACAKALTRWHTVRSNNVARKPGPCFYEAASR